MSSLHNLQTRYTHLNDHFDVLTSRHKPATPEQVQEYQQGTGLYLPDEFREFLTSLGQLVIEVNEEIWTRPKEMEVLPLWKFGYGFYVFGLSGENAVPEWLEYPYYFSAEESPEKGQLFFQRSGNMYRAYINQGQIIIEYDPQGEDTALFEGNIYDFLIAEIDKLEADYHHYISGESE